MGKHDRFILSSAQDILNEGVELTTLLNSGMDSYPLMDYVLQALFLKLTGYNEQKLKCILWELATDDYEFRYNYTSNRMSVGECSSYSDKSKVYMEILKMISENGCSNILNAYRQTIIDDVKRGIENTFEDSYVKTCFPRAYVDYTRFLSKVKNKMIMTDEKNLIKKKSILYEAFMAMYKHRNRCAHNLESYQENIPCFNQLSKDNQDLYDNWYTRFFVIILVDSVFVYLYAEYLNNRTIPT